MSVRKRWIHETFLAGDNCDESAVKEGVAWLYNSKKMKQPKVFIADSPFVLRNMQYHMIKLHRREAYQWYRQHAQACFNSIWPDMEQQLLSKLSLFLQKKHADAWKLHDETNYLDYINKVIRSNYLNMQAGRFLNEFRWWHKRKRIARRRGLSCADIITSQESLLGIFEQIICYDFLRETAALSTAALDTFIEFLRSGCFITALSKDSAIVVRRPLFTKFNHYMSLHSEDGPAVQWRDGRQAYHLNGVRVPKEVVMTPAGQLDPIFILKVRNAEARMEVVRKIGIDKLITALKGRLIDTWKGYELIQLSIPDMVIVPLYLKMTNPSTGALHFEGVPPEITSCREALSWRIGGEAWDPQQLT